MDARAQYIRWFEECDLNDVPTVGGKNASLGELLKADIPVPPGFAVTTELYHRFLDEGDLKQPILNQIDKIQSDDTQSGEAASRAIRAMIEETPVSLEIEDYIAEFYRRLSKQSHIPAVPAAVPVAAEQQPHLQVGRRASPHSPDRDRAGPGALRPTPDLATNRDLAILSRDPSGDPELTDTAPLDQRSVRGRRCGRFQHRHLDSSLMERE